MAPCLVIFDSAALTYLSKPGNEEAADLKTPVLVMSPSTGRR